MDISAKAAVIAFLVGFGTAGAMTFLATTIFVATSIRSSQLSQQEEQRASNNAALQRLK